MKKIMLLFVIYFVLSGLAYGQEEIEPIDLRKAVASGGEGRELSTYDLLRTEGNEAVPFLIPYLLNDPYPKVREIIAEGLGKYGDASIAVPALLKAREDKSPMVRGKVADSLIKRGHYAEALDVLIGLIKEKEINILVSDNIGRLSKIVEFKNIINSEYNKIIQDKSTDKGLKAYCILELKGISGRLITEDEFKDIKIAVLEYSGLSYIYLEQLTGIAINDSTLENDCLIIMESMANSSNKDIAANAKDALKNYNYKKEWIIKHRQEEK